MLESVMLVWFLLTALALAFVAVDIRSIPESPVLKWGFLLLTAYTGVVGAFLYVVGLPPTLARTARTLHGRPLAANAWIDDALRCRRRHRHSRGRSDLGCP
jgi:hypothetical protein